MDVKDEDLDLNVIRKELEDHAYVAQQHMSIQKEDDSGTGK